MIALKNFSPAAAAHTVTSSFAKRGLGGHPTDQGWVYTISNENLQTVLKSILLLISKLDTVPNAFNSGFQF